MQFQEVDILELLPQQPPFVMVDRLLYCDPKTTQTALTVREENIFFDKGRLSPSGVIELIAQTCATRMGYINLYIHREQVKLGFIGAIRNLELLRLPKVGERLTAQIETLEEVFQMTLVSATVKVGDELLAQCEMKISITDVDK